MRGGLYVWMCLFDLAAVIHFRCCEFFDNMYSSPMYFLASAVCHLCTNALRGDVVRWNCLTLAALFKLIPTFLFPLLTGTSRSGRRESHLA